MKKTKLITPRARPRRSYRSPADRKEKELPNLFELWLWLPVRIGLLGYEIGKEAGAREEREKNGAKKKIQTN